MSGKFTHARGSRGVPAGRCRGRLRRGGGSDRVRTRSRTRAGQRLPHEQVPDNSTGAEEAGPRADGASGGRCADRTGGSTPGPAFMGSHHLTDRPPPGPAARRPLPRVGTTGAARILIGVRARSHVRSRAHSRCRSHDARGARDAPGREGPRVTTRAGPRAGDSAGCRTADPCVSPALPSRRPRHALWSGPPSRSPRARRRAARLRARRSSPEGRAHRRADAVIGRRRHPPPAAGTAAARGALWRTGASPTARRRSGRAAPP